MKDTIKKILTERKTVVASKADAIQTNLAEMEARTVELRKELDAAQTEIADIDELLNETPNPSEE